MGTQKNATYKVHNGTDFDEINFKTIAAQVKMASGVDLENGFLCTKSNNGYSKLPNGIIFQWGEAQSIFKSEESKIITFNINFPNKCLYVAPIVKEVSGKVPTSARAGADWFNLNNYRQTITSNIGDVDLDVITTYFAIGY